MKTLKKLTVLALFTLIAGVTFASNHNVRSYDVNKSEDFYSVLKKTLVADFNKTDNFLQQNDIDELNESVDLEFYVDKHRRIQVVTADSENQEASNYIKQLFDEMHVNANAAVINQKYKMKITLFYE